jgi:5'-3' exonuclease
MRYVLIDTANMFFRARHGAFRASDTWEKIGFALHVTLMSANKVAQRFKADHVVFALEGRSWRKDFYEPYKKNRAVARAALTEAEQDEDKMFWETYDALTKYLAERTNCSVIQCPTAEGDDIIARWIALHPQDEHIIISSDTDFVQLIAPNVTQYNGISDEHITLEGYFDAKGKQVIDKKKQQPKTIPDPKWLLFEKCMRGDTSDNVFSAFPGVRTKGTKNKVGLQEAFELFMEAKTKIIESCITLDLYSNTMKEVLDLIETRIDNLIEKTRPDLKSNYTLSISSKDK